MKLWLDDIRPAPAGWFHVKTATGAIRVLSTCEVDEISLDHDLGDDTDGTGYTVATFIEERAAVDGIFPPKWNIHSANPVGREKMTAALENAERLGNW